MQTLKFTFFAFLATSVFFGCKKDHSPIDPIENEIPELVKTVVRPDFDAIKRNSRTPAGELDKVETTIEGEKYANSMPGTRQYLYDNVGRNVGFADQLTPRDGSRPGFCDLIYEYKDNKIFRLYTTNRGEGYWGELLPTLVMREFIYDKSDRVKNVYIYVVDENGVATRTEYDCSIFRYDEEGRLVELSSPVPFGSKTIYKYSGKNVESTISTYSDGTKQPYYEYSYHYKYDSNKNGLTSLPAIPKLFHPGAPFFDQIFGENSLVSMKISSSYNSTTVSETNIGYSNKFDSSGRLIEKIEDFKDGTPLVKKVYFYK